jgi:hypothetical protein
MKPSKSLALFLAFLTVIAGFVSWCHDHHAHQRQSHLVIDGIGHHDCHGHEAAQECETSECSHSAPRDESLLYLGHTREREFSLPVPGAVSIDCWQSARDFRHQRLSFPVRKDIARVALLRQISVLRI